MEFSLVTTNHLVDRLWFLDDNDYKAGMNYVAITAHQMDTDVLAFILMSNHVHFVLCSDRKQAFQFIYEFKRNYSAYLHRKYGFKEYLRKNEVDIQRVGIEEESLERAIAYVQMNSVAANICLHPSGYPWGTGNTFFKQTAPHGRKIGTMSKRAQKKYLKSNVVKRQAHFFSNLLVYVLILFCRFSAHARYLSQISCFHRYAHLNGFVILTNCKTIISCFASFSNISVLFEYHSCFI